MELYTLNEVSKYYERWNIRTREKNINYVIKNLNLTIKDNEFIVVVGKSGIGKTTLLKMLGGIEKPSAGSIFYTNKELYQCKESEMEGYRRKEIGFIFQDYRLLDEMRLLWKNRDRTCKRTGYQRLAYWFRRKMQIIHTFLPPTFNVKSKLLVKRRQKSPYPFYLT